MEQFLYLNEYLILICKQCAYAIPPTFLTSHLKRHLHGFRGFENRAALSALEKHLRGLSLVNLLEENVVFPDPNRPPLPEVPLHNGFKCRDCLYFTTSLAWIKKNIQTHQLIKKAQGCPANLLMPVQVRHNLFGIIFIASASSSWAPKASISK